MKRINIITLALLLSLATGVTVSKVHSQATYNSIVNNAAAQTAPQYTTVNALDIVAAPTKYLNKNIRIKAKFDKYSTLGLDYKPAMRSSEKYISFLIQRPDVLNHDIPLSELKIFLKKEVAEKNIDLDSGDEIEFTGKVFSTALGDAWMDVDNFKVLTKKNPKKDEEKSFE
ncbi:hypothetical protein J6G99_04115 [bacterium]|nr:hypothetical protein [bacterium]